MAEREMSVRETAARALAAKIDPEEWETWLPFADAALLAIGYPTEALDQPASAWVVVPVEATPDMYIAGGIAWHEADAEAYTAVDNACACYRAMIAARPGADL